MALSERLHRLRNFQSRDFWAMVFARPLTILLLLPVADARWVTPDRITVVALLFKLGAVALLALCPTYGAGVAAAVLVNLGLVFDNMDGTLARYRRCGSHFGYYLDKVSDAVTLALVFWAYGYRAFVRGGDALDLALPAMAVGGAMVAGYAMWVADRVKTDLKLRKLADQPDRLQQWALQRVQHDVSAQVPERTWFEWVKWLGWAIFSIVLLNEVDIFFWIAVTLILDEMWLFTRVLCPLYTLAVLVGPLLFAYKIRVALRDE